MRLYEVRAVQERNEQRAKRSEARPHVFVTRKLPGDAALARLRGVADVTIGAEASILTPEEILHGARGADAILCLLTDRIDAALLTQCTRLRVISSCSVGVDHIDLMAATQRGIPVGHTPGVLTETTADLAFALLIAAARRIVEADRFVRRGQWTAARRWEPDLLLGKDLFGATLGIVGLGAIGQAVARRAQGFGMRVLAWNRTPRAMVGVENVSLAQLLEESDFVSLHVALARETKRMIDAAALARMKPGAILVNTARGDVVDTAALVDALRSGPLAAAALDVFDREPLEATSPLLQLENVVLAPHIGSASEATRKRMTELSVENLLAGLAGKTLPHCANPDVYAAKKS